MSFFAVFGFYVVTSMIFFRYPNILHRRRKVPFKCRHISHRGGAGEGYENTIPTFRRALALGTDMLELDVHLTKDSKVVVSHDTNLLRSTGVDKDISTLKLEELPLLKEHIAVDSDPDHKFTGSGDPQERKFALLEDVFQYFPDVPINIDIKVNNDALISEVSKLITKFDRAEKTVWGSFDNQITTKCYRENPRIHLLFSTRRVIHLILLFYSGLLPFIPLKESHLEIFLPSIYLRKNGPTIKGSLKMHNLLMRTMDNLLMRTMDMIILRPALFSHLRKRGIETYIWVLNYEDEFRAAFEVGVDGVMTDYPTRLKKFLEENQQYAKNLDN